MVRLGRVRNEYEALRAFQAHGSLKLVPCKLRRGWIAWAYPVRSDGPLR